MTQTNNSELEKWDKAIADEIENQGRDMEIAINNVLNIVHELRDQAFAAGEASGIAKAEKCVPEIVTYNDDDLINYGSHHAAGRNFAYREVRENIAKLKNL